MILADKFSAAFSSLFILLTLFLVAMSHDAPIHVTSPARCFPWSICVPCSLCRVVIANAKDDSKTTRDGDVK